MNQSNLNDLDFAQSALDENYDENISPNVFISIIRFDNQANPSIEVFPNFDIQYAQPEELEFLENWSALVVDNIEAELEEASNQGFEPFPKNNLTYAVAIEEGFFDAARANSEKELLNFTAELVQDFSGLILNSESGTISLFCQYPSPNLTLGILTSEKESHLPKVVNRDPILDFIEKTFPKTSDENPRIAFETIEKIDETLMTKNQKNGEVISPEESSKSIFEKAAILTKKILGKIISSQK